MKTAIQKYNELLKIKKNIKLLDVIIGKLNQLIEIQLQTNLQKEEMRVK